MNLSLSGDRGTLLTGAALLAIAAAAWIGVLGEAERMAAGDLAMDGMAMQPGLALSLAGGLAYVSAWLVMMAAMMLPSAAPMVLLYRSVAARQGGTRNAAVSTALFVGGYLVVWGGVGIPLYLAQGGIAWTAEANQTVAALLPWATAAVLVLAGAYQFTPLKSVCLRECRSPLDFLMVRWRGGLPGGLRLGVDHGLYCMGCCWALMAVLVVAGAMGLAWVALIALVVFVEKLLPRGELTARVVGVALLALGGAVALQPELAALIQFGAPGAVESGLTEGGTVAGH